jgi:hypothetical protein
MEVKKLEDLFAGVPVPLSGFMGVGNTRPKKLERKSLTASASAVRVKWIVNLPGAPFSGMRRHVTGWLKAMEATSTRSHEDRRVLHRNLNGR